MSSSESMSSERASSTNKVEIVREFLLEHRPRLQSASIFIRLQEDVRQSVKVNLKSEEILLEIPPDTVQIPLEYFTINPHTLSSMVATRRHISFRVSTNVNQFDEEILSTAPETQKILSSTVIPINLKPNQKVKIFCSNCKVSLLSRDTLHLRRILELPSETADSGEWFCHKITNQVTPTFFPKTDEIFYGNFFLIILRTHLVNICEKESNFFCQRCLLELGKILDNNRMKLWNESVLFQVDQQENVHLMPNADLVSNFSTIIRKILMDFTMAGLYGLVQFHKIAIQSHFPDGRVYHLLLQVVDKSLEIYRQSKSPALTRGIAMKIMYQSGQRDEMSQVSEWERDSSVSHVEISPKMLQAALQNFTENSQVLPRVYRSSCGFQLTYLYYN
ncbi:hypothetical protein DMENIID0001_119380 [Sergentomyia squamirostris]